ncbi:MAG: asparaginase [Bdellovibrio sp. CG12_big_fil_rev_8_21_14_0_65_39_13]|nr:MAG: asparaginase [Bdellovibrio sp. CG22_combo_CG10-13_8_21_14_all_39_27]PIQ58272.1 MAG: asparaginase [Bdellovibrio sp. CG12_big_fil_rev_8_21_14_0_65_39_13]PIR36681.1 MAG: asparaginase [Bdellovibrio sp. CG11_big_fil_rev_8_21_14_0_20_39_38]
MDQSNLRRAISVLTTGGTIEKSYDEGDGSLDNRDTIIKDKILSKMRLPYTEIIVQTIMHKDSLYMTEEDRQLVLKVAKEELLTGRPIVILHGTDTMTVTAELLKREIPNPPSPIIFTGAMKPLGFDDSDAAQNVIEALYAAKILAPGIYISFHNQIFNPPFVRKNRDKRTFEFFDPMAVKK